MNAQVMPSSPQPVPNLPVSPAKTTNKGDGTTPSGSGGSAGADLFAALLAGLLGQGGGGPGQGVATTETQEENLDAGAVKTAGEGSEPAKVPMTEATLMMLGGLSGGVGLTQDAASIAVSADATPSVAAGTSAPADPAPVGQVSQGSVIFEGPGASPATAQGPTAEGIADSDAARASTTGLGAAVGVKFSEASDAATVEPSGEGNVAVGSAETGVTTSETAAPPSTGASTSSEAATRDVTEAPARSKAAQTTDAAQMESQVAGDGFDEARGDIISQTVRVQRAAGQGQPASVVAQAKSGETGERDSALSVDLRAEAPRGELRKVVQSRGERAEVQEGAESSARTQLLGRYGLTEGESGAQGQTDADQTGTSKGQSLRASTPVEDPSSRETFELRPQTAPAQVVEPDRVTRGASAEQPVQRVRVSADEFVPAVRRAIPGLAEGTRSEMQIQLVPEHLGKVTLKVAVVDGMVTARFNVENGAVKQLVESRLPELRQALETQGLRLDTVNVGLGSNSGSFGGAFSQADVPNPRRFANALKGYDAPVEDQVPTTSMARTAAMQAGLGVGRGSVVDALA